MEKESEIQLLESLDQLEVCFSESVSHIVQYTSCSMFFVKKVVMHAGTTSLLEAILFCTLVPLILAKLSKPCSSLCHQTRPSV